jgi:hypothetical protein
LARSLLLCSRLRSHRTALLLDLLGNELSLGLRQLGISLRLLRVGLGLHDGSLHLSSFHLLLLHLLLHGLLRILGHSVDEVCLVTLHGSSHRVAGLGRSVGLSTRLLKLLVDLLDHTLSLLQLILVLSSLLKSLHSSIPRLDHVPFESLDLLFVDQGALDTILNSHVVSRLGSLLEHHVPLSGTRPVGLERTAQFII